MLKKKLILLISIIFISSCGYAPIYSDLKNINFSVDVNNFDGDREINNFLKTKLKRYSLNKKKHFDLKIKSEYFKITISKDLKGVDQSYELKTIVTIDINLENRLTKKITFVEKSNINNLSDSFEEQKYERTIKKNFVDSITRKLILQLSQIE